MTDHAPEPILVLNPKTKTLIDISPIINYVNEHYCGDFNKASKTIDDILRSFVCYPCGEMDIAPSSFSNHCFELFNLRDVFSAISEIKVERSHA